MTDDEKDELSVAIAAMHEHHKKSNNMIAEILREVVRVLEKKPPSYPTVEQLRKIAEDRKALPDALRKLITLLEKE